MYTLKKMKFSKQDIARLASFPEQNPNPVVEIDYEKNKITYINPAGEKLFPELIKTGFNHSLFAEVRKKILVKKDFQCEVTAENFIFEQKIYFIHHTHLIRVYSSDITQMKHIEKNLSRLASFPEQNPSPIIEVDMNMNVTYFNPAALVHFPDFHEKKFEHIVLHGLKRNFSKFQSGELHNFSEEVKISDKYYDQRSRFMSEGNVIRMFNIDITPMKLAEEIIRKKNKDITDSITYAKRIQNTILPSEKYLQEYLQDYFIFYQPKDIVSGDFYWVNQKDDKLFFAAIDCTGHGVPGALVSMVAHANLQRAVTLFKLRTPAEILDLLNESVQDVFNQQGEGIRDGMDIALCGLNREKMQLEFSGANNSLYIINSNRKFFPENSIPLGEELPGVEIPGDSQPIGFFENGKKFSNTIIDLQKGDMLYIFSDGYADQFGGPKGKKFMTRKFKELLVSIHQQPLAKQKNLLEQSLRYWRANIEQVDDILVIGVRV